MYNRFQVVHIGQHVIKMHKVLDPQMRKRLCSKSSVLSNSKMSRFDRDECPLRGFMATSIDQHL